MCALYYSLCMFCFYIEKGMFLMYNYYDNYYPLYYNSLLLLYVLKSNAQKIKIEIQSSNAHVVTVCTP